MTNTHIWLSLLGICSIVFLRQTSSSGKEEYIRLKALNEAYKELLVKKNNRIHELEKTVHSMINAPKYYIVDQSRKIEISDSTINTSGAAGLGLGDIIGTAANKINM